MNPGGSPDSTGYTFNGQDPWFYQDWGTVNDGYGHTGAKGFGYAQQPSGADQYIGWLETPQPGTNLTNLGEQFTYVDAFTSNGTFYQAGYSVNATGLYFFAATTYSAGGYDYATKQWGGIGCLYGPGRTDYPPGKGTRGITGRGTVPPSVIGVPVNQELEYDVHAYQTAVYADVDGNESILSSVETSHGYVYTAQGI